MSAESLHRLEPAIRALGHLAKAFSHLPTTDVEVRTVYRHDAFRAAVVISVHEGLADFEAWREALGILPEDVKHALLPTAASLRAETEWGGVWIEVHGYGPLPVTAPESAEAVAS
jgi:hypothetical protein